MSNHPIDPAAFEERIREQERSRIARDLHDELGAHLTGIGMALGQLREGLTGSAAVHAVHASRAQALLAQASDAMHAIIDELHPPIVEFGLLDTLRWQSREFTRSSGIACRLVAPATMDALDPSTVLMLLRIVREALANVARHARARQVTLSVATGPAPGLRVGIADDGCGFAPSALAPLDSRLDRRPGSALESELGSGLGNMRHRARALGGTLQITSAAGQGTVIMITLPVAA